MTSYPSLPLHIDSTMLTCFRACPQKFFLEFVEGLRPPGLSIDLHAGACFAGALEEVRKQVYQHKRPLSEALLRAEARYEIEWGDFEIPEYKNTAKTRERVWEAIVGDGTPKGIGYFQQYAPLTDSIQPFYDKEGKPTFEYTFAIPLEPYHPPGGLEEAPYFPAHPDGGPFLYTGRFDMLGLYQGRPTPEDDKTTGSSIGANWTESWDLRNQFLGYTWACRQCGLDTEGVLVRGIAIQKTQIVHAESYKPYSQHLLDKWYEQLRRDLWRIRRSYDERYFDYNFGDSCTSYGHCVFMQPCGSAFPESWLSNFERRHWNPLNKNPTVGAKS